MSFIWRTGSVSDPVSRTISERGALALRITTTSLLALGLLYLCAMIKTFARYGGGESVTFMDLFRWPPQFLGGRASATYQQPDFTSAPYTDSSPRTRGPSNSSWTVHRRNTGLSLPVQGPYADHEVYSGGLPHTAYQPHSAIPLPSMPSPQLPQRSSKDNLESSGARRTRTVVGSGGSATINGATPPSIPIASTSTALSEFVDRPSLCNDCTDPSFPRAPPPSPSSSLVQFVPVSCRTII